jgi:septal ring factor EnvC (AmiA/AmiB activator)
MHGVEIAAAPGSPVRAVAAGRVAYADWYKGFGRCVVLDHGGGTLSVHGHADAVAVSVGDEVAAGQTIATVGETGSLSGPLLYFELFVGGEPVDPLAWLAR